MSRGRTCIREILLTLLLKMHCWRSRRRQTIKRRRRRRKEEGGGRRKEEEGGRETLRIDGNHGWGLCEELNTQREASCGTG